jgi:hypothetical protein
MRPGFNLPQFDPNAAPSLRFRLNKSLVLKSLFGCRP